MSVVVPYLLQPPRLILGLLVLSAAYVHYRGRVRLKFVRQVNDHSTFAPPDSALVYLCSRAPNRPFLDPAAFPELKAITDNWQVFRDEGLRLMDEARITASTGDNDVGFHIFFKRGWKRLYLKWYKNDLPSARTLCPNSTALLDRIPTVHGAMFATLPPGANSAAIAIPSPAACAFTSAFAPQRRPLLDRGRWRAQKLARRPGHAVR
jgi:beta-hydroxylase